MEWVAAGKPLDSELSHFYHAHPEFGSRDRRLFSGTLYSCFRWKGWIDRITPSLDTACVLAHLLEASELHPALLLLAERQGMPATKLKPMRPLSIGDKAIALEALTGIRLSLTQLVPDWVVPQLGSEAVTVVAAFQTAPPTWLRTSPEERAALLDALRSLGAEPSPHPVIHSALSVQRGINLRSLPHPIRDRLTIQDLASQVTGLVCDPQPGQGWWDACCGSGGKTFHLADLGGARLSLLATDVRPAILDELTRRLRQHDGSPIHTAVWDGRAQPPPEGSFDGILLDAPCSGTGTWHRNPDARWRLDAARLETLRALQADLLKSCALRLKSGGTLIYATCSVLADENESIVAAFLATTPSFRLLPFSNPLTGIPCNGMLRIDPAASHCNGMFIAKLTR